MKSLILILFFCVFLNCLLGQVTFLEGVTQLESDHLDKKRALQKIGIVEQHNKVANKTKKPISIEFSIEEGNGILIPSRAKTIEITPNNEDIETLSLYPSDHH